MIKININRNNYINKQIRQENEAFNENWIYSNKLVGTSFISSDNLDINPDIKMDAYSFQIVWLQNIKRLCTMFEKYYEFNSFSLIDVGCGSGISTLFFKQNYNFKRYEGFDFSLKLIGYAKQNAEVIKSKNFNISNIKFKVEDAKKVFLPNERLAIFLFNPFGLDTMKIFLSNNIEIMRKNRSIILYANDKFIEELLKFGTLDLRDDFYNLSIISF
jgi:SAM-dependent methyltransferase